MFGAYFDESGTHDDDSMSVAGYLGIVREWDSFGSAWVSELERSHLDSFHSNTFWHEPRSDRLDMAKRLAEIINGYSVYLFGRTVCQREYSALTTQRWRSQRGSAYAAATQVVIGSVMHWADNFGFQSQPIAFVFEQGHRNQNQAHLEMDKIQRSLVGRAFPHNSYSFASKNTVRQLEPADMVAYLVCAERRGLLTEEQQQTLDLLKRPGRFRFRHIDEAEIRRWIEAHRSRLKGH